MNLTPRDKRMLQVLGVVAGLALGYFVFTTVLAGDGEDAATGPTGSVLPPSSPSVTVTPSVSPTANPTLPPVVLAGARDPFSIPPGLDVSPGGGPAPTGGGTTTATPPATTTPPPFTTTPPATTTPPPPTSPPPTSPPPPPPPPPDDEITIGGHDVILLSVNNRRDRLQVEVDGKVYTVEEGARFDETFRLVNIDGNCARFLFGDQSFTLCDRHGN